MRNLEDKEDPNFSDADYLLAAYAATLKTLTGYKKIGDIILVKVKRFGQEFNFNLVLKSNPAIRFKLEKIQNSTPEQESLYKKWLFIK
jgi:hypothetical protein